MENVNTDNKKKDVVEKTVGGVTNEFVDGFDGFEPLPDTELKKVMGGQDYIVTNDTFSK